MYSNTIIIGRLGRDPELRWLDSGSAVCDLSVASDYKYTKSDGTQVQETTWWRVSFWGKVAENVEKYMKKGRLVYIEGRIKPDLETGGPRLWESSEGDTRASFELMGNVIKFLDKAPEGETSSFDKDDELPF